MNVLDLFSGIGGFSLGLMMANRKLGSSVFETIAFCEIHPYCREFLKKNFPNIPIYEDVKGLSENDFEDENKPEFIVAGIPRRDSRELFFETMRLIRELEPDFVLLENSPQLVIRLKKMGYSIIGHNLSTLFFMDSHARRFFVFAFRKKFFLNPSKFQDLYFEIYRDLYKFKKENLPYGIIKPIPELVSVFGEVLIKTKDKYMRSWNEK